MRLPECTILTDPGVRGAREVGIEIRDAEPPVALLVNEARAPEKAQVWKLPGATLEVPERCDRRPCPRCVACPEPPGGWDRPED